MLVPDDLLRLVRAHHDDPTLSVYVEAAPTDLASQRAWRVQLKKGIHVERRRLAQAPREERERRMWSAHSPAAASTGRCSSSRDAAGSTERGLSGGPDTLAFGVCPSPPVASPLASHR